jgi:invasion protein IalB
VKTINHSELYSMSLDPIKRAVRNWIIRCQVSGKDRHIDVLRSNISNDQHALRVLEMERALLARRVR